MVEQTKTPEKKRSSRKTKLNFTIDLIGLVLMMTMIETGLIIRYILPPGSGGRGGGHGLLLLGMDRHEWGGLHFWLSIGLLGILVLHVALHWSWVCNFVRKQATPSAKTVKLSRGYSVAMGVVFIIFLNTLIVGLLWAFDSRVFSRNANDYYLEETLIAADEGDLTPLEVAPAEHIKREGKELKHDCENENHSVHRGDGNRKNSKLRRPLHRKNIKQEGRNQNTGEHHPIRGYMTLAEVSRQTGVSVQSIKASLNLPSSVSPGDRLGQLKRKYGFRIEDVRKVVIEKGVTR